MPSQKRDPQGSCADCQASIPKKHRYCAVCLCLRAEREKKIKEGVVAIRTSSGTMEIKTPAVVIHKECVFSFSLMPMRTLAPTSTLGEFVNILFGILRSEPEYLLENDICRHFSMLYQFQQHEVRRTNRKTKTEIVQSVSQLPLAELGWALRSWVVSYMGHQQYPLMSTYAIDSAQFILAHAYGDVPTSDLRWRMSPLFPPLLIDQSQSCRSFFEDPQFKRRVTEQIGRLLVLVEVPVQARYVLPSSNDTRIGGGSQFLFEVQRCHLSSGFHDYIDLTLVDDLELKMYLSENFRLYGKVVIQSKDHWDYRLTAPTMPKELASTRIVHDSCVDNALLEVPVRWISHLIVQQDDETILSPVPEWRP